MPSADIRKFNRFELKYIISLELANELKQEALKYASFDNYNGCCGRYRLVSLYYDSTNFKYYWEKKDGLRTRRKLRIRWYEDAKGLNDGSIVYLEIKQRVDRVTQKRRVPVKYKEALLFCEHGIIPKHDPEDAPVIEEMYEMVKKDRLQKKIITSYDREALIGSKYDLGFRLTFDSYINYSFRDLNLDNGVYDGFAIPPNFVIMEIKTNERLPYWVTEMVAKYQLSLIRVSKYCQGVDHAHLVD